MNLRQHLTTVYSYVLIQVEEPKNDLPHLEDWSQFPLQYVLMYSEHDEGEYIAFVCYL